MFANIFLYCFDVWTIVLRLSHLPKSLNKEMYNPSFRMSRRGLGSRPGSLRPTTIHAEGRVLGWVSFLLEQGNTYLETGRTVKPSPR